MNVQKSGILITGAGGFLGHHLVRGLSGAFSVAGTYYRHERGLPPCDSLFLDITDPDGIQRALDPREMDVIVHTAAVTNPDQCEKHRERAFQTNVQGTELLAEYARKRDILFIYISSDLVFDGEKGHYTEKDPTSPGNYYAETKCLAEAAVRRECEKWLILRASLMYGWGSGASHSFIDWMFGRLEAGKEVVLFRDQYRSFLFVEDVAPAIRTLLNAGAANEIIHLGGPERMSRHEFGGRFVEMFGYSKDLIRPILMSDLKDYAARGRDCTLSCERILELGFHPRTVAQGLAMMKKVPAAGRGKPDRAPEPRERLEAIQAEFGKGPGRLPRVRCPKCRKTVDYYDNPFRPFCSERCSILDLGAWADEAYRIPAQPDSEEKREEENSDQS